MTARLGLVPCSMSELQPVTIVEQVAAHLREGIRQGRWRDEMPGRDVLARRGILAPEHVSLICIDPDPGFAWCKPSIAHTYWDSHPLIKHVCRWVNNVARGRSDLRQTATPAQFVEGGTIGPVPKR